jgi:hypothetical protein
VYYAHDEPAVPLFEHEEPALDGGRRTDDE